MAPAGYNAEKQGLIYMLMDTDMEISDGVLDLLECQATALAWIIGWVACTMTPFFLALNLLGMLRVDPEEEELGLDLSHHRGAAYDFGGKDEDGDAIEVMEYRAASTHGNDMSKAQT